MGIGFPKPEPQKRTKRRKQRAESVVVQKVRARCVERDGDCRLSRAYWHCCAGESEWAHLGDKKRARTRGMQPEQRHTTEGSVMLCTGAHRNYDSGQMTIRARTARGADGPLLFSVGECVHIETNGLNHVSIGELGFDLLPQIGQ
jgi:hypothetical protein